MKACAVLALLPCATAFVPAGPRVSRGRSLKMNFGYENGERPIGGVQFWPDAAPSWVSRSPPFS